MEVEHYDRMYYLVDVNRNEDKIAEQFGHRDYGGRACSLSFCGGCSRLGEGSFWLCGSGSTSVYRTGLSVTKFSFPFTEYFLVSVDVGTSGLGTTRWLKEYSSALIMSPRVVTVFSVVLKVYEEGSRSTSSWFIRYRPRPHQPHHRLVGIPGAREVTWFHTCL